MKVLFGVWALTSGGAERVLAVLCNTLAEKGHDVHLYIRYHEKDEYWLSPKVHVYRGFEESLEDLRQHSVEIKKQPVRRKVKSSIILILKRTIPGFRVFIEIIKTLNDGKDKAEYIGSIIENVKPELIIPFLLGSQIEFYYAERASTRKNSIYVFTVRAYQELYKTSEQIIQSFLAHKAQYIWCQTERQKEYYGKKLRQKTFVLGNPVNDSFLSCPIMKPKQIRTFIAVGRLVEQKNYPLMIHGFKHALEVYPNLELNIYGSGEEKQALLQLIQDCQIGDRVFIHDRVQDILHEMLNSDCFLLSSVYEGMPNALMEAMAIGLPCISTDCLSGPKELIGDNERGVLIPCNDEVALVKAICSSVSQPDLAFERAEMAAHFIRNNYNSEEIAKEFIDITNTIINEKKRTTRTAC